MPDRLIRLLITQYHNTVAVVAFVLVIKLVKRLQRQQLQNEQ
jgi:hypothetical protein